MGAKMGRPQKDFDRTQFEKLCFLQCTLCEIADFFDCNKDTITAWCKRTYGVTFSEIYKKYSVGGKISLRRHQFKIAERNATMAIWLGKQYLGQRDVQELKADVNTIESKRNPFEDLDVATLEKLAHYGESDGSGGNPS